MHPTALKNAASFFSSYKDGFIKNDSVLVVEIGSQDVNGSLKDVCPKDFKYIGVDFQKAKNVDVVLSDPYKLPFENESIDIIVTSSCFEHSEMFWLVFLEVLRVLKPKGLFYINTPSRGNYHRYPVDCWRFYPDSGVALSSWGKMNNYNNLLLESYTQKTGPWGDLIAIFLKDANFVNYFPNRIVDHKKDFINGRKNSEIDKILNRRASNNRNLITFSDIKKLIPKSLMPLILKFWNKINF